MSTNAATGAVHLSTEFRPRFYETRADRSHTFAVMFEYAIDNRRIMERAYAALAAGDLRGFAKPLAPGLVKSALEEVLHPFAVDVDELRIDPREVTAALDRVIVTGRYTATRRGDRVGLAAAFRHEWHMTYGVAWRLVQESWGLTERRVSQG